MSVNKASLAVSKLDSSLLMHKLIIGLSPFTLLAILNVISIRVLDISIDSSVPKLSSCYFLKVSAVWRHDFPRSLPTTSLTPSCSSFLSERPTVPGMAAVWPWLNWHGGAFFCLKGSFCWINIIGELLRTLFIDTRIKLSEIILPPEKFAVAC